LPCSPTFEAYYYYVNATIGNKIVEKLSSNGVTSESKTIHTPLPSPPFKVGVLVAFYK